MYESHMILLNSTVPYTGGANVAGTLLSLFTFYYHRDGCSNHVV